MIYSSLNLDVIYFRFLLFYYPRSQVRILIYRNWLIVLLGKRVDKMCQVALLPRISLSWVIFLKLLKHFWHFIMSASVALIFYLTDNSITVTWSTQSAFYYLKYVWNTFKFLKYVSWSYRAWHEYGSACNK